MFKKEASIAFAIFIIYEIYLEREGKIEEKREKRYTNTYFLFIE